MGSYSHHSGCGSWIHGSTDTNRDCLSKVVVELEVLVKVDRVRDIE